MKMDDVDRKQRTIRVVGKADKERQFLTEFGMTAASRSRIRADGLQEPEDPLERLLARPQLMN